MTTPPNHLTRTGLLRRIIPRTRIAAIPLLLLVLFGGLGVTSAVMTQRANVNVAGIGTGRFEHGVVSSAGLAQAASADAPYALSVDGAETLLPGGAVTADVTVFNNSPTVASTLDVFVEARGDGAVGSAPNITPHLRLSVFDEDGTVLLDGAGVGTGLDTRVQLAARGQESIRPGEAFRAGAEGSVRTLRVQIAFERTAESVRLGGGLAGLDLRLVGTSTVPQ
ncbi:hypothetical protein ACL9RL_13135 [Plantibacter sp. Mn2098]|uniref:hypothetical protein n=1 Tax=Plantibacter sp. Mn2098 TaxID=3395266 RepID=UPI003BCD3D4F